ncbi:TPA: hypothetical protein EYG59_22995 [Candidatus Poribacteria bacterium]|nr:hypothetical protein [Candidatus Poribacteria bacterium]
MALPPGRICVVWELDDEFSLVRVPDRLVFEIHHSQAGRFPSLSECQTILFRVNSRGVHHWNGLDYHWRYF